MTVSIHNFDVGNVRADCHSILFTYPIFPINVLIRCVRNAYHLVLGTGAASFGALIRRLRRRFLSLSAGIFEVTVGPSTDFTFALVPIAPFLAAFLAPYIFRFAGSHAGWILAIIPASIFIYLLQFIVPIAHGNFYLFSLVWIPVYDISLSFFVDGLSLAFGLLISGIGTIIIVYSGAYLSGHAHQGRFLAFILMFMGSMLGLVFSDNMIALFVFWELTSITSFLLIGFDHTRQASRRAAIQALVITGGGGLLLLAGIALLHALTINLSGGIGTWSLASIRGAGGLVRESALYLPILLLFLAGAFTKSAQFPFHFWLPNAMEAPTPVSAFLHSATMVKAGIYLLARMNPTLGGTLTWNVILVVFGGITLLWGAFFALRQTDMKQMLAQTTIASLGLLVLLIGVSTETAIAAAVVYLIAHAFYKAALFLVAGLIDHGTGTREITELGGLRAKMPITFLAALLGALSMAGLPITFGYFAKEEMYAALAIWEWQTIVVLLVVILGNALMMATGLAIAIIPFFGGLKSTPLEPHEGGFALYAGPIALGVGAIAGAVMVHEFGEYYLVPVASAIYNLEVESHLKIIPYFNKPAIYLSLLTWVLGAVFFWQLPRIRLALKDMLDAVKWTFDTGFDQSMSGLIRASDAITRFFHHGRLEIYILVVFIAFAMALYAPVLIGGAVPVITSVPSLSLYEWGAIAIAVLGLGVVLAAKTRLIAIVSLGIQGFAVALIFMLFGAPDLSFTQFMVEVLSVVILALVMTRLHLDQPDHRPVGEILRDAGLAIICGIGVTMLLLIVLQTPLNMSLPDLFAATSVPVAHGHNIVNVILVDYRGLDTLGEIAVVMTAGIAIYALIRMRGGGPKIGVGALPSPAKTAAAAKRKTSSKRGGART